MFDLQTHNMSQCSKIIKDNSVGCDIYLVYLDLIKQLLNTRPYQLTKKKNHGHWVDVPLIRSSHERSPDSISRQDYLNQAKMIMLNETFSVIFKHRRPPHFLSFLVQWPNTSQILNILKKTRKKSLKI